MSLQCVVFHPGRQHSHRLAEALFREKLLTKYYAGIPTHFEGLWILKKWFDRHKLDCAFTLPANKTCCIPFSSIVNQLKSVFLSRELFFQAGAWASSQFDKVVSEKALDCNSGLVVGYENSSLKTFSIAKSIGIKTILDAASFHHSFQDSNYSFAESHSLHQKIINQKNKEIELADLILTCSDYARQSYINAGVHPDKVVSVPVGVDIAKFSAPLKRRDLSVPFTFAYTGKLSGRKGVHLLLKAFAQLLKEYPQAQLKLIGPDEDINVWDNKELKKSVSKLGKISHDQIVREYQNIDCFVFPSFYDSFGMAVAEAMACGLPVIVSDRTGAKQMIESGKNGWVFNLDQESDLLNRMLFAVKNRLKLQEMGVLARKSAENYSWERYYKQVVDVIVKFYNSIEAK